MHSRVVRRLASWIALVAIVAVTFMPTITTALSSHAGANVCSAEESRGAPSGGDRHALDHCPYCALHAALALPPAPPSPVAAVALRFSALPDAFVRAPRASGVWSTSQPRAPPVVA